MVHWQKTIVATIAAVTAVIVSTINGGECTVARQLIASLLGG